MTDPEPRPARPHKDTNTETSPRREETSEVGAYYTGEDVATFMARRGLWEALLSAVDADLERDRVPDGLDPERLYRPGEVRRADIEGDGKDGFDDLSERYGDQPAVLEYVDAKLRELTVCDPAAGGGALLLAAAETLFEWRSDCVDTDEYVLRREILTRNIFGVDIREDATEACNRRLRDWLLEAAPVERDARGGQREDAPRPDLGLNVRTGNSLLGFVDAAAVTGHGESPTLDDPDTGYEELKRGLDRQYAARGRDSGTSPRLLDHVDDADDAWQSLTAGVDSATLRVTVPEGIPDALAEYLDEFGFTTYTYTARLDDPALADSALDAPPMDTPPLEGGRVADLFERLRTLGRTDWDVAVERDYVGADFGPGRLDACHWPLAFPSVFRDGGGFDLVISNPPYGAPIGPAAEPLLTDEATYECQGAADSCEWFYERALDLAGEDGAVAYVVTKAVAFYSSWSDIRQKLLDETALKHVFDVGLGFADVNLETVVLVHTINRDDGSESENGADGEGSVPAVHRSEDPRQTGANRPVHLGWVDQRLMRDSGTIIFRPVTDEQRDVLDRVLACDRRLGDVMSADGTTRQLYIPDSEKRTLDAGDDHYINKNRWVGTFHLEDVWHRDLDDYRRSVEAYAVPRVMLKVLRGSRLRAWLDPDGELVGTEKLVNVPLETSTPAEIAFVYAALNHPCASYYLQKAVFSETTETARVMDGQYSEPIPLPDPPPDVERAVAGLARTLTLARQVDHDSTRTLTAHADRVQRALDAVVGALYLDRAPDRLRVWSEGLLADGPPTDRVRDLFGEFYTERFATRDGDPAGYWDDVESTVEATADATADWETDRVLASREMRVVRDAL